MTELGRRDSLYNGIMEHRFAEDVCFLCGTHVDVDGASVEHVVPKWLQQKFNLWNVRVHLLNGTPIRYRSLVIPCCRACNNVHLAKVEKEVAAAVNAGSLAVREMNQVLLAQLLLKVFFGFVYRELFLPIDRRQGASETIVLPADMEQFQMLHYILQSVRIPMRFHCVSGAVPVSIFVFDLKEPTDPHFRFDYRDEVIHKCLQIRMGGVGILAAFDMGFQATEGSEFFPKYYGRRLHPIQFDELAANLFSKARTLAVNPSIIFCEDPSGVSLSVVPPGISPFAEMKMEDVARMLQHMTGLEMDVISPIPGRRITFLEHENGSFRDIPIDMVL